MCKFLFLSTLSLRRATHYDNYNLHCVEISIHALLAESDSLTTYLETSSIISIHALLAESDSRAETVAAKISNFYPRSPCGERQQCASLGWQPWYISIHALLAESDFSSPNTSIIILDISIHALLAESDPTAMLLTFLSFKFLSTLSLRRATPEAVPRRPDADISIHALLAESDTPRCKQHLRAPKFLSTLSLRRATTPANAPFYTHRFLSTLSLRRATRLYPKRYWQTRYFYPRSPCGERPAYRVQLGSIVSISIHALLAESDLDITIYLSNNSISIHALLAESDLHCKTPITFRHYFYPRSPCGERRSADCNYRNARPISIHALLAESDGRTPAGQKAESLIFLSTLSLRRATSQHPPGTTSTTYFYPRSPCGERRECWTALNHLSRFLSTLSLRRATTDGLFFLDRRKNFYPRSPCGERLEEVSGDTWARDFYPRSPCGERRDVIAVITDAQSISIHALLAESDKSTAKPTARTCYFYPRSPCGERRIKFAVRLPVVIFLSTLSLRRATCLWGLMGGLS